MGCLALETLGSGNVDSGEIRAVSCLSSCAMKCSISQPNAELHSADQCSLFEWLITQTAEPKMSYHNPESPGCPQSFNNARPLVKEKHKIYISQNHENENNFALDKDIEMFSKDIV